MCVCVCVRARAPDSVCVYVCVSVKTVYNNNKTNKQNQEVHGLVLLWSSFLQNAKICGPTAELFKSNWGVNHSFKSAT